MSVGIVGIGTYVPDQLLPLRELDEIAKLDNAQREIFETTLEGMDTVSVEPELDGVGMAVRAAGDALKRADVPADSLDLVLYLQSRSPPYLMASEATRFQHEIGATSALAFAITDLGCANVSAAMLTARSFLQGDDATRRVLIAGASQPFGARRYREQVTMVGDGAFAMLMGQDAGHELLDIRLQTDGEYWDLYKVDYRGKPVDEWSEALTNARYKFQVAIKTRNIFETMNSELLKSAGIDAPATYVMQNLAIKAFDYNEKALGVSFADACRTNCRTYGHLGGVDIPLNIDRIIKDGEAAAGEVVLIQNNSPVACWSSALLRL